MKERSSRIVKAINAIEDAVAYLRAAPHDFGGHRRKPSQTVKKPSDSSEKLSNSGKCKTERK